MRCPLIAGAVLAALAACGGKGATEELEVSLTLDPSPAQVGDVVVELELSDAAGNPLEDAKVHIEGNMNHAGMVPELADAKAMGDGRYVAEIEFTMGGDWFLVVAAQTSDGRRLERVIDVPGVAAN